MAAAAAGAAVAVLGGLIGLGGAEFRLPILIAIFALYPHRAIRINDRRATALSGRDPRGVSIQALVKAGGQR